MESFSLQSWYGALLPWWGDWKQSLCKKPILVLWIQSTVSGLNWRKSHWHTGITAQCWKAVASRKLSPSTAADMHFLSSCGCFSRGLLLWWKKCSYEYVVKDMSSSLHKLDCILATESHRFIQLAINIGTSHMGKNIYIYICSCNGCTSYIYFQTSGI